MASRKRSFGNAIFLLLLAGTSAAAFYGGFHYTYQATLDVNAKSPLDEAAASKRAMPAPRLAKRAEPAPEPAKAVDPLPPVPSPSPVAAAPQPLAPEELAETAFEPSPAPKRAAPVRRAAPSPAAFPESRPAKAEVYRVQVGAFDDKGTAQKQVDELQAAGINAVVVFDAGRYHAQLGAFGDREHAISVADEVNLRGYSVTIRH